MGCHIYEVGLVVTVAHHKSELCQILSILVDNSIGSEKLLTLREFEVVSVHACSDLCTKVILGTITQLDCQVFDHMVVLVNLDVVDVPICSHAEAAANTINVINDSNGRLQMSEHFIFVDWVQERDTTLNSNDLGVFKISAHHQL